MITENKLNKIKKLAKNRIKNIIVVLEDIKDKHNAGAILRTCDAFGIPYVYFIFNKVEEYEPKDLISSSVGSSKWLVYKIFSKKNFGNPVISCIKELKEKDFKIIATIVDEKANNIFYFNWPDKVALFLGNEVNGLSEEVIKNSDFKVYIPMKGMVESLNVSVSAGIFIYDFIFKKYINNNKIEFFDKKSQQEYVNQILNNLNYNL